MLLAARNVGKVFGQGSHRFAALKNISFEIPAGDYVAIMGPSGSGKSTLMNILGLLDRPTSGALMLCDEDLATVPDAVLAARRASTIGFVFQSYNLLARQTALENVEMPLAYAPCPRRTRRRLALQALESVGLEMKAQRFPCQLSGGEQQRVAIARALVRDPPLLLADEPTGALDAATGGEILSVFEALNAAGRAVVLITHDEDVGARARRLLRLRDGNLAPYKLGRRP